jgi:hypothetical protein
MWGKFGEKELIKFPHESKNLVNPQTRSIKYFQNTFVHIVDHPCGENIKYYSVKIFLILINFLFYFKFFILF